MERADYTYVFADLSDTLRAVTLLGRNTAANVPSTCKVAIDDSQLLSLRWVPAEVADLIDLAVSVSGGFACASQHTIALAQFCAEVSRVRQCSGSDRPLYRYGSRGHARAADTSLPNLCV